MNKLQHAQEEARRKLNKTYVRLAYGKSEIEQTKKEVDEIIATTWESAQRARDEERDVLFQEINVKKLLEQMEKDLLEYGQYHDPDCQQMSEWADSDSECDCETIKAMRSFATEWVGKTNEMWVFNLKEHRKHCSSYGNKDLTQRKRKVLLTPKDITNNQN